MKIAYVLLRQRNYNDADVEAVFLRQSDAEAERQRIQDEERKRSSPEHIPDGVWVEEAPLNE